jgi:hypothetical protein
VQRPFRSKEKRRERTVGKDGLRKKKKTKGKKWDDALKKIKRVNWTGRGRQTGSLFGDGSTQVKKKKGRQNIVFPSPVRPLAK